MARGETTRVNPDTGEEERGRWMFGKWFKDWTPKPKSAKGKSTKGASRSRPRDEAGVAPDVAPDSLNLPSRPSMARDIGQAIEGLNTLALMLPWTAQDALTQGEAERLVYGLDEAQKANATVRKYVKRGAQGAGVWALAIAVGGIVVTRLAAHGWLPGTHKLSPEEYAAAQAESERMYAAMRQAGMGMPPDPMQPPTVPPIYSNGGTVAHDGPVVFTR